MPAIVQSSRLYSLKPCGIATSLVESLIGYIARLAEAHCVSVGVLYTKEIAPVAGKGSIFSFRLTEKAGYPTHAINSLGITAADFVRAMEMLTKRADLRYLTLLPWSDALPKGLQRRARAWRPNCLRQWRDAEQTVYEPLLRRISAVTVCPSHLQRFCLASNSTYTKVQFYLYQSAMDFLSGSLVCRSPASQITRRRK